MNVLLKRVNQLLNEHRMTQIGLAEKIGVTQPTLSRNLNGIHSPRAEIIEKIAQEFNVSVDFLLGRTEHRQPITHKSLDEQLAEEMDGFQFALYDEVNDLTDEQKEDLLQMVRIFKKNLRK